MVFTKYFIHFGFLFGIFPTTNQVTKSGRAALLRRFMRQLAIHAGVAAATPYQIGGEPDNSKIFSAK
ncbi:MAG: hypothetical protein ABUL66_02280, partial [Verrucomicrobiota bacterium]